MRPRFCSTGLEVGSRRERIFSGSVHYWRLERELWPGVLDRIKELGFRMVETYVPWQVHEIGPGLFDFGERDNCKDLDYFLSLCWEKSLYVMIRPGPHINAELPYFGYPERIIMDPEIQARTAWGTPCIMPYVLKQFPVPSYASEKFYHEVGVYFDAVAPILRKYLYPKGPLVAIQSDNETTYFFMLGPYVLDYSSDSIALYRKFLLQKYGTLGRLNEAYRSEFISVAEIDPPTGFRGKRLHELPYYFDWAEYKEYQIIYANKRITEMWVERGIELPTFHNMAADDQYWQTPYDMARFEETGLIDVVGIDCYSTPDDYRGISDRVKFMSATSRLPFIPEFGSGAWYSHPRTFSPQEEEFSYLYAYMHGLKAANFYMLVDRDRWQGAPIARDGRLREEYARVFHKISKFLQVTSLELMEKQTPIVVIRNYDIGRLDRIMALTNLPMLSAIDVPEALLKSREDLGLSYLAANSINPESEWVEGVIGAIRLTQVDYDLTNSHITLEKLKRYSVAIMPTFDFIDTGFVDVLRQYIDCGGRLIIGPEIPYLDANMRSFRPFKESSMLPIDGSQVALVQGSHEVATLLDDWQVTSAFRGQNVEVTYFTGPDQRTIVFAANIFSEGMDCRISFQGKRDFRALINSTDMRGESYIDFWLRGQTVCAWEVS
jgi:beta-galactosidase